LGDKSQFTLDTLYFSKKKISVANMNYRLAPKWKYDAPLVDISTVLKLIDADKDKYGLTADYKIVLVGHSAGGHLVGLYCLKEASYGTKNADFCIGLAGVYDLTKIYSDKERKLIQGALDSFLGDTKPADASPSYQVSTGEKTKFLLMLGSADEMVSPEQMSAFETALKNKSVSVSANLIPGRTHNSLVGQIPNSDEVAQKILSFIGR